MKSPIHIDIPKRLPCHPCHPSIQYVHGGWNDHRYWMAQTPWPPRLRPVAPYADRWELPCIHYSDDGIHWKSIPDNPLDDLSDSQIETRDYYSDPHLILHGNVLYCYYRHVGNRGAQTTIFRKRSHDGFHWTSKTAVVFEGISPLQQIISPSIVFAKGKWLAYYVNNKLRSHERGISVCESQDGIHFGNSVKIPALPEVRPWHIDVQFVDNRFMLVAYDANKDLLTLFTSDDGCQFQHYNTLIRGSKRLWDFWSYRLYRACFVSLGKKGDFDDSRVYFSAQNGRSSFIGMMECSNSRGYQIADCLHGTEKVSFVLRMLSDRLWIFAYSTVRLLFPASIRARIRERLHRRYS